MTFFDKFLLPSSMSYSEMIFDITEDRVGYCYSGTTNKGAIMIKKDGKLKIVKSNITEDLEKIDSFEMWAYIDLIENSYIRQKAVNRFLEFYLDYNPHIKLDELDYRL